jgi:hypothetical protein
MTQIVNDLAEWLVYEQETLLPLCTNQRLSIKDNLKYIAKMHYRKVDSFTIDLAFEEETINLVISFYYESFGDRQ